MTHLDTQTSNLRAREEPHCPRSFHTQIDARIMLTPNRLITITEEGIT